MRLLGEAPRGTCRKFVPRPGPAPAWLSVLAVATGALFCVTWGELQH